MNRMIFVFLITLYAVTGTCNADTDSGAASPESNVLSPPAFRAVGVDSASAQIVALSSPDGATIYYTTDGSDPGVPENCGSAAADPTQMYSAPIALSQSSTLKAVACKSGAGNSAIASKIYTKLSNQASYLEVTGFGSNPGDLIMYRYIPSNAWENSGLIVVLHGCGMSAEAMKGGLAWNELAEKYKFYVVYGQQTSTNHVSKCFRFYDPSDNRRDQGEALSIEQMVDYMAAENSYRSGPDFHHGFFGRRGHDFGDACDLSGALCERRDHGRNTVQWQDLLESTRQCGNQDAATGLSRDVPAFVQSRYQTLRYHARR
ncbi:MAG: FN3 associated domain-containing protein [Methylococcales bacterium]